MSLAYQIIADSHSLNGRFHSPLGVSLYAACFLAGSLLVAANVVVFVRRPTQRRQALLRSVWGLWFIFWGLVSRSLGV